jgi:hypothetical protein
MIPGAFSLPEETIAESEFSEESVHFPGSISDGIWSVMEI